MTSTSDENVSFLFVFFHHSVDSNILSRGSKSVRLKHHQWPEKLKPTNIWTFSSLWGFWVLAADPLDSPVHLLVLYIFVLYSLCSSVLCSFCVTDVFLTKAVWTEAAGSDGSLRVPAGMNSCIYMFCLIWNEALNLFLSAVKSIW